MNNKNAVKISILTAITIAVADMVGIGVFTSLGFQVADITSGFTIMLLWTLGGIVALCGALCYAELAAMFPRSGGEYNFLSKTYHPAVGFMSGWLSATIGFSAPIAAAAMAFGGYFKGMFPEISIFSKMISDLTGGLITNGAVLLLGLGLTWSVTLLQLRGIRNSSIFQNFATIIKIGLIFALIIFGFSHSSPQPVSFIPTNVDLPQIFGTAFAISLVYVMYSYSGWNASTYIIDEVDNPQKTLPRAILAATVIVMVLYVALNLAFLYATPIKAMVGQTEVALIAGQHIFGNTGGKIVAGIICFGLISTVSAMIWIGSRVAMVMGEDLPILGIFSRKNRFGIPTVALFVQAFIVTVMLCTQSFDSIVKYIAFSITLSSFVTVLGVIVLRFTQPDIQRPYRTWGYPVTPIIFLAVTLFMMTYMLYNDSTRNQSLAGLATIFSGLVIYLIHIISTKHKQSIEPVRETS